MLPSPTLHCSAIHFPFSIVRRVHFSLVIHFIFLPEIELHLTAKKNQIRLFHGFAFYRHSTVYCMRVYSIFSIFSFSFVSRFSSDNLVLIPTARVYSRRCILFKSGHNLSFPSPSPPPLVDAESESSGLLLKFLNSGSAGPP